MKGRHLARELALSSLYALDFNGELSEGIHSSDFPALTEQEHEQIDQSTLLYARYLVAGTLEHLQQIDELISRFSINRPLENIDIIDRNILRLSIFTLLYADDIHDHVVITEAVKLSQEYSREVNYKFINGILDSMRKELHDHP
ncbi:MAG: transcription antitermination factor NusB [Sphaerochaetaceae bacterium]